MAIFNSYVKLPEGTFWWFPDPFKFDELFPNGDMCKTYGAQQSRNDFFHGLMEFSGLRNRDHNPLEILESMGDLQDPTDGGTDSIYVWPIF